MKEPVFIPQFIMPKKDGGICECKQKQINMEYKTAVLHWHIRCGQAVQRGDILCDAEVEKSLVEITSPYDGKLGRICVREGKMCGLNDVIGYIETVDRGKENIV